MGSDIYRPLEVPEFLLDPAPVDPVEYPGHYMDHPSGVECIEVAQHFNFNLGNVIKYVWRAGAKGDAVQDLRKARKYLDFEIARLEAASE